MGWLEMFRQKGEPPPPGRVPRPFNPATNDDQDDDEIRPGSEGDVIGALFAIDYENADGEVSSRDITIRSLAWSVNGDMLIKAYCHTRRCARCFRVDRIIEMASLATGEIYNDAADFLRPFAPDSGDVEAKKSAKTAINRCRYGLQILAYFSHCDGQVPEERAVILDYVADRCEDLEYDQKVVYEYVMALHPDSDCFIRAARYAREHDGDRLWEVLKRYIVMLVDADGVLSIEESGVWLDLDEIIKQAEAAIWEGFDDGAK